MTPQNDVVSVKAASGPPTGGTAGFIYIGTEDTQTPLLPPLLFYRRRAVTKYFPAPAARGGAQLRCPVLLPETYQTATAMKGALFAAGSPLFGFALWPLSAVTAPR